MFNRILSTAVLLDTAKLSLSPLKVKYFFQHISVDEYRSYNNTTWIGLLVHMFNSYMKFHYYDTFPKAVVTVVFGASGIPNRE